MKSLPEDIWNKINLYNSHPCADMMRPHITKVNVMLDDLYQYCYMDDDNKMEFLMHNLLSSHDDRNTVVEVDERSFNELSIDEQLDWICERDYNIEKHFILRHMAP